jgi:hypothetical protein
MIVPEKRALWRRYWKMVGYREVTSFFWVVEGLAFDGDR